MHKHTGIHVTKNPRMISTLKRCMTVAFKHGQGVGERERNMARQTQKRKTDKAWTRPAAIVASPCLLRENPNQEDKRRTQGSPGGQDDCFSISFAASS